MTKVSIARAISALAIAGCIASAPAFALAATYEGDANVDQRNYPSTMPFVHPPFYNALVEVETDDDGVITSVVDNGTGGEGSVEEGNEEFWQKKNQPFFQTAVDGGIFDAFVGKTLEEVEEMDMGVDGVAGASLTSAAVQEAVVNALEGKAGKTFLPGEGCLMPVMNIEENSIFFENLLPEDFEIELLDVRYGILNSEEQVVDPASYTFELRDGQPVITFEDIEALAPGWYYVNIVDASGTYRSPSFEGGPGLESPAQAAYFVIDSGLDESAITFDGEKIAIEGAEVTDYMSSIESVTITPVPAEGEEQAADESAEGEDAPEEGTGAIEQEQVGHHGTPNAGYCVFDAEGNLNPDGVVTNRDGSETALFEEGVDYTVTIVAPGFPTFEFSFSK